MALQPAFAQADEGPDSPYEFDAGVTVSVQAMDNVFLTANDRRSDFVTVLSRLMGLSYRTEDVRLSLEASSAIARFADYAQEDFEDYFLSAEMQYRINENVFAFGGLDYELGHEGRESPDDVSGISLIELRETSGYLGIGGTVADRSFRLGLTLRDLNFKDTPVPLGEAIDYDDRNRRLMELGGRIVSTGYLCFRRLTGYRTPGGQPRSRPDSQSPRRQGWTAGQTGFPQAVAAGNPPVAGRWG